MATKETAEQGVQRYLTALDNDSPIVSTCHLVLRDVYARHGKAKIEELLAAHWGRLREFGGNEFLLAQPEDKLMDPNANLAEQRTKQTILRGLSGCTELDIFHLQRLAELALALDEWISKGGFLPDQWEANRPKGGS